MIEMAGSRDIYRIDYFLIKDWDVEYGFDWIAERDLVDSFLAWVEKEDQLHWSRLTTAQSA